MGVDIRSCPGISHGHVGHQGTHQGTSGVITLSGSGQVKHDRELHPVIEIHQKSEVGGIKDKKVRKCSIENSI